MAKKKRQDADDEGKKVSTQPIRVETDFAKMIVDVAEAKNGKRRHPGPSRGAAACDHGPR